MTMQVWRYTAEQADGRIIRGEATAASRQEAVQQIRTLGAIPVKVQPANATGVFSFRAQRRSLSLRETVDLVRGIADLASAELPLKDVLASLGEREKRPALKAVIARLEARVRRGDSLSTAVKEDPAGLPRSVYALAEAGEESGLLARNFTDLAEQLERDLDLRGEIIGQLVYPAILLVVFMGTLLFLAHFILPTFETVFADAGAEPPGLTGFVIAAGAFIRGWGVWIPVGIVGLAVLVQAAARLFPGQVDQLLARLPAWGWIRLRLDSVRYCQALGLLLSAGRPLAKAEPIAREAIESAGLRSRHARAADRVRAGDVYSSSLEAVRALPDDALRLISMGEKTGHLDTMLMRAAALYDREVRARLKAYVELIGPAMIIILALCIGGVIASVIIGVLSLNEAVF
ncbi:type II secretion system F family protein [Maricaulis parjimensis]|uniref:type II secretion system F family protein n=1 Tax=Maricaulis parjimensis TaxID=144023 RepID=UPI00193985A0|nr:type II secretion system F family protein [Maricaulis parjimensis]